MPKAYYYYLRFICHSPLKRGASSAAYSARNARKITSVAENSATEDSTISKWRIFIDVFKEKACKVIYKDWFIYSTWLISRAHSFPWPAEFRAEHLCFYRGICLFAAEFHGIWRFSFDQLFFHRKWPQSSSATSLFMMIFCLMAMVEWGKWWLMNE